MLSLIISIVWVCFSILNLGVKATLMMATKRDVERIGVSLQTIKDHYEGAKLGNKIFWVVSAFGILIVLAAYALGIIKAWVVVVEAVVFVLCIIMNILLLGYLRKKVSQ